MEAAPTGDPGKAPASYISSARAAVRRPSLVAPILTFMYEPDVGPEPSSTSARLIVTFTGCPDCLDSTAATGST